MYQCTHKQAPEGIREGLVDFTQFQGIFWAYYCIHRLWRSSDAEIILNPLVTYLPWLTALQALTTGAVRYEVLLYMAHLLWLIALLRHAYRARMEPAPSRYKIDRAMVKQKSFVATCILGEIFGERNSYICGRVAFLFWDLGEKLWCILQYRV